MNILYLHGFGSRFSGTSPKCKLLSEIGTVYGCDIDYTKHRGIIKENIETYILNQFRMGNEIDMIIGTSMGGYMANVVGVSLGLPFVMINPSISPYTSLCKRVGTHTDFYGNQYTLEQEVVDSYKTFDTPSIGGCGFVILDRDDELFDYTVTQKSLKYRTKIFDGGSHRFDHMEESLPLIEAFFNQNFISSGMDVN
tara:strand:+ start:1569 stop:2156 length:588 start_codon:yes stop_codon:yes gene_type:complete